VYLKPKIAESAANPTKKAMIGKNLLENPTFLPSFFAGFAAIWFNVKNWLKFELLTAFLYKKR
jgi:hypothetical protein